jgi:hypothetical protein
MGLICIISSWFYSYPIHFSEVDIPIFFQFEPIIWPGVVISLIGLFIVGYVSRKIVITFFSVACMPLVLYSYKTFFSYFPSSDAGNVRAMFEIVSLIGLDSTVEPYFQYPMYFILNNYVYTIIRWNVNNISMFFFFLYGVLISMFLFLYISKNTKKYDLAFLCVFLYFIGVFLFINYQWVPQTLALVYFIALLYLSGLNKTIYRLLLLIIFTVLVFTHAFIPVMFLIYFGFHSIKQKNHVFVFIICCWIYLTVLFYHTTAYLPDIINVFQDSVFGVGEYQVLVSRSLKDPIGLLSQSISLINRILVPLVWVVTSISFFILFIKKKLHFDTIFLAITGGVYLIAGIFFTILGTRALQIIFIPLVTGIEFYKKHWKKGLIVFIVFILIISVFLPIRKSYDNYFFQLDEEMKAGDFFAYNIPPNRINHLALSQISGDYVIKKMVFYHRENSDFQYPVLHRPHTDEFYNIFNRNMRSRSYLLYNQNLGKHISAYGLDFERIDQIIFENLVNNKVYASGETYLIINN